MSENLYAPPSAELGSGGAESLGGGDFDVGRCLSEGWERCWANFPLWLGAGFVGLVAMILAALTVLGIPLLLPVLLWGSFVFVLRMYDGGASVGDFFSGFSRYGRALATMLGFWIVTFAVSVLGQVPLMVAQAADSGVGVAVGQLVNLGVTFFVGTRLSFAGYLLVERDLSVGEAISQSWERTGPLKWKLAGLMLLMFAVIFAGLIALIVGVIPASVVGYLMWTSAYRQIFGGAPKPVA